MHRNKNLTNYEINTKSKTPIPIIVKMLKDKEKILKGAREKGTITSNYRVQKALGWMTHSKC